MATNFFWIGYHFEELGAKWLSEKKVNFTPCSNIIINDDDKDDDSIINYHVNTNKMILIIILFKNFKQTRTFFVKYIDALSFWLNQSRKAIGINNTRGKLSESGQQSNQTGLMISAISIQSIEGQQYPED